MSIFNVYNTATSNSLCLLLLPLLLLLLIQTLQHTVHCRLIDKDIDFIYDSPFDQREYLEGFWDSRLGSDKPPLKMLKRQIRCWPTNNGPNGQRITVAITLVFLSSKPAHVRWLRYTTMQRSTIPGETNKVPIRGNANYRITYITSGRVTANTLTVQQFEDQQPVQVFETILTTADGTIQYRLRTQIRQRCGYTLENIDGPEWVVVPPTRVDFEPQGQIVVQCAAFIAHDNSATYTNELTLTRVSLSQKQPSSLDVAKVMIIHRDSQKNIAEEEGVILLFGKRYETAGGHVIYHVGVSTPNATEQFAGVYNCVIERQYDRLYAISNVVMSGRKSVVSIPESPLIEVSYCRPDSGASTELTISEGVTSCIRCRAFADPPADVAIYRGAGASDAVELGNGSESVIVSRYIAADGLSEVTYTIYNPTARQSQGDEMVHAGYYHCTANNTLHVRRHEFRLKIVR